MTVSISAVRSEGETSALDPTICQNPPPYNLKRIVPQRRRRDSFGPALECHCKDVLEGAGVVGRVVDGVASQVVGGSKSCMFAR